MKINLNEVVGKGYKDFWYSKHRYRVVKGSKGSKKSKTMALWIIYNIMKHKESNAAVFKKVARTIKKSVFNELQWAIGVLKVNHLWKVNHSEYEFTYKPTNQKIYCLGLDDPTKLGGLVTPTGNICWAWIEEAYELLNEDDFEKVDFLLRGELPDGLYYQITLTFNPWSRLHWIRERFFKDEEERNYINDNEEIFAITTTYTVNEFLDEATLRNYERLRKRNVRLFDVIGNGNWGITEGLVFNNFEEREFDIEQIKFHSEIKNVFGLDFGYTNDPSAFVAAGINLTDKRIYIYDEFYKTKLTNDKIVNEINYKGYSKEEIVADSQEAKSIDELYKLGITRIKKAYKGKDSILNGIQYLQQFEIFIHPNCKNTLTEFSNYVWDKDKNGTSINRPIDKYNHIIDALRYATESARREREVKAVARLW